MTLEVLPVPGIGDVTPGDDLAALIGGAAPWLRDGDILVVTSKIVSKAEGRLVEVPADGPDREAARAAAIAAETARVVAVRGPTRIVQTRHGFVMAAAGIDASNVDKTHLVLLPTDPDASARALRAAFAAHGLDVAIIVSDTMGRPWRNGLTDVALGAAGLATLRDHRGETDPYGNELHLTQMAVADELAAAGELVKGKCDGVPVAVVRGYRWSAAAPDDPGAAALVRVGPHDMFSLGTAEARAEGLRAAALLADAPASAATAPASSGSGSGSGSGELDAGAVGRAVALVAAVMATGTTVVVDGPVIRCVPPTGADPAALIRFGADVHRLRAALAAEDVPSDLRLDGTDALLTWTGADGLRTLDGSDA